VVLHLVVEPPMHEVVQVAARAIVRRGNHLQRNMGRKQKGALMLQPLSTKRQNTENLTKNKGEIGTFLKRANHASISRHTCAYERTQQIDHRH